MYKVIKFFTDLHDANYAYQVGDEFPRPGTEVTEKRIAELAGSDNKQGVPLIALVEEKPKPKKAAPKESKAAAEK